MRDTNGKNKAHKDALLDWAKSHRENLRIVELGRTIIPFGGVYATKWAVEALSENLAYEFKPLGIDIAIVQPGPFPTEIFQKSFTPGNISLTENYGKSTEIMIALFNSVKLMMSDENVPNKPQDVADAILNLVNQPQGKRPLRTVVDKMMGDYGYD